MTTPESRSTKNKKKKTNNKYVTINSLRKRLLQQQANPTDNTQHIKYNPKLTHFGCDNSQI